MDCPHPISQFYLLPHMVVANQALHENTKVKGPGVEARPAPRRNADRSSGAGWPGGEQPHGLADPPTSPEPDGQFGNSL